MHNGMKPIIIELLLDSGIRVHVKPLSPFLRVAIIRKLFDRYPDPDPKEYEAQIPGEESPGATIPPTHKDNPRHEEFKAKSDEAERNRNVDYIKALIDTLVSYPDFADRNALIDYFRHRLRELQSVVNLPDDVWEAVRDFCIIGSQADLSAIQQAANGNMELVEADPTEEEVADAMRLFRPAIPRGQRSRFDALSSRVQQLATLQREISPDVQRAGRGEELGERPGSVVSPE